jgi:hypothetical protein
MRLSKISAISAFARPEEHLTRQTLHGAIGGWLSPLMAMGAAMVSTAVDACAWSLTFCMCAVCITWKPLNPLTVTLVGCLLASTLFVHELSWFLSAKASSKVRITLRWRGAKLARASARAEAPTTSGAAGRTCLHIRFIVGCCVQATSFPGPAPSPACRWRWTCGATTI